MARVMGKRDLAAEAWRPLARFFFETASHRSEIFRAHGLTPNDAKALWALDANEGKTMSALARLLSAPNVQTGANPFKKLNFY